MFPRLQNPGIKNLLLNLRRFASQSIWMNQIEATTRVVEMTDLSCFVLKGNMWVQPMLMIISIDLRVLRVHHSMSSSR
jgi:hypothetical protein